MKKFGIQYLNKNLVGKIDRVQGEAEQYSEIMDVLTKFQAGYTARDLEKVDEFLEELFIDKEDTYILGTSSSELLLGREGVRELIAGDWEYWGDLNVDCENAHISVEGEVAWVTTTGTVKYTFEDSSERNDGYVNFIKEKAEEAGLTAKEKITFINWVLSLTYHQRENKKREYLWPMGLSGVLLKDNGKWKFSHIQFSIVRSNFPDERFENDKEYVDSYNELNSMCDKYKNNQITEELKEMLKNFATELYGQKDISKELVSKYFAVDGSSYVLGTENQICEGIDEIREYLTQNDGTSLSLDLEHAIASKAGEINWVTVNGLLRRKFTEDELAERALEELDNLFKSELTSKEKLFAAHRSVACALKESAAGVNHTCPIRMTAVISNNSEGLAFNNVHFSFPFNWIFEGKLDGVLSDNSK